MTLYCVFSRCKFRIWLNNFFLLLFCATKLDLFSIIIVWCGWRWWWWSSQTMYKNNLKKVKYWKIKIVNKNHVPHHKWEYNRVSSFYDELFINWFTKKSCLMHRYFVAITYLYLYNIKKIHYKETPRVVLKINKICTKHIFWMIYLCSSLAVVVQSLKQREADNTKKKNETVNKFLQFSYIFVKYLF